MPPPKKSVPAPHSQSQPIQILVVDDVPEMLQLIAQMIQRTPGLVVSSLAKNTWEARLELTRRRPDIVLLDEILPGESSLDLLNDIRSTGIPVLLLTSLENPTHPVPKTASGRLVKPGWKSLDKDRDKFLEAVYAALNPKPVKAKSG